MGKSEDYLEELLKMDEPLDTEIDFDENLLDEDLLDEDLLDEDLLDEDLLDEDLLDEDFLDEDLLDEDLLDEDLLDEELPDKEPQDQKLLDEELPEGYLDSFADALEAVNEKNALHDKIEESFIEEVIGNLDSIVSGANDSPATSESDFNVEEFSYDDVGTDVLAALQEMSEQSVPEITPDIAPEPQLDDTEADVLKILEGLGELDLELEMEDSAGAERSEENKANDNALLDFLASSAMAETSDSVVDTPIVADAGEETDTSDKKKKKSSKNGDKKGLFSKLGTILFGEDDEEEVVKPAEKTTSVSENVLDNNASAQEHTDDTLDLFKDFAPAPPAAKAEVTEPEDKKKKKKDKKEKVKKEKVKKEKKPKPKKEKKPKEPDNTPPLPKKPVILIFLMVASFVALIMIGTNLLGYSNALTNAENAFVRKNYTEAYSYVSGMEIKEKDIPLYEKYQTMALISSEYDAYKNLMAGEFYDLAFDSLIRMVGRCEKFREDAQIYGCEMELNALEAEAENILNETFKMTIEEALELYNYRDRRDYSKALNAILKELGMEKVIEE